MEQSWRIQFLKVDFLKRVYGMKGSYHFESFISSSLKLKSPAQNIFAGEKFCSFRCFTSPRLLRDERVIPLNGIPFILSVLVKFLPCSRVSESKKKKNMKKRRLERMRKHRRFCKRNDDEREITLTQRGEKKLLTLLALLYPS